jgi:hypothetical protein
MKTAIHRCIDFTKSSKNIALLPALETVDLEATVREQMRMLSLLNHNVTIELIAPSGVCLFAITDKHWLAENTLCLLSNAVKYSDGGLIEIRIQVLPMNEHDSVDPTCVPACACALRITISDSGIGISESARASLFQPFQQAQKMAGGTGLGLYSLRKRVEALGGRCGVASRDDGARGSAFWFDFPYRPDAGAMKAHARSHQCLPSTRLRSGSDSGSDAERDANGVESCTSKMRCLPIAALTSGSAAGVGGDNVAAGTSDKLDLASIDVFLSPGHSLLELDRTWAVCRSQSGNAGGSETSKHTLQPLKLRILLGTFD